jgi:uncharacterized membrane protein YraQ (UPF0718 family)
MNNKKNKKRIGNGIKFLAVIILLYLLIAIFNFSIARAAFLNFLTMFSKILPVLGVVFLVMIGVNKYFTEERAQKYLGEKSGIKGWVYAIISGALVSGPPYILFPLLGNLKKQGMKNSLLAVFLYNRNVKIPFLPAMIYYFGISFTVIVSLYIVFFSILNGLIIQLLVKDNS